MKKIWIGLAISVLCMLVVGVGQSPLISRAAALQDTPLPEIDAAVEAAVMDMVAGNRMQVLGFLVYDVKIDHIVYSADGSTALVWLALVEPETGEVIAAEPALSIARNTSNGDPTLAQSWGVTMNTAFDWHTQIAALPEDLLTDDIAMRFLPGDNPVLNTQPENKNLVFTGYKLPWAAGLEKRLTGSLGHIYTYKSCVNTCRYAFDFADGTMFPLLAAKGGTVKQFKYTCQNGDTGCTNYIILEDQSTTPVSYQVYYHMAYDSIPQRLRSVGARVMQGEYVGNVDDTGASSGHHLHYHVFAAATIPWEWGYSVDITFDDVPINGGRPRTCAEATAWPNEGGGECMVGIDGKRGTADDDRFKSGNIGAYPPVGAITFPPPGYGNAFSTLSVSGFTHDDQGVTRVQVLGFFNSTWNVLGDAVVDPASGNFSAEINVCQAKIPQGDFELAVRIFDREGNQAAGYPGQRTVNNGYPCYIPPAPPACNPGANEVALYANTDFLGGSCKKFAIGKHSSSQLGNLGNDQASSIQVGANVRAILYDFSSDMNSPEVLSRIETFEASDASLADNYIGDNHVSAVWVQSRPMDAANQSDLEPFLTSPGNTSGAAITSVDSLVLAWEGGEAANQFRSEIRRQSDNSLVRLLDWQYAYSWSVGSLPAGNYIWSVTARNSAYPSITNNTTTAFEVTAGSLPSSGAKTAPFVESFEQAPAGWTASGLWRLDTVEMGNRPQTTAYMFNDASSKTYNSSTKRGGDLTSPPITLPAGAEYYLRFSTYAAVEDGTPYWDQRRVQISVNNEPFYDLYQFADDYQEGPIWMDGPAIKLVAQNGQPLSNTQVRIRFHFNSTDEDYNNLWGWMVDNVSVNSTGPDLSCADTSYSPETAIPLTIGQEVQGVICPQGDVDYYRFTARAGQAIQFDLDANPQGLSVGEAPNISLLDSYIFLLDSTGRNVIMENDDEIPASHMKDSRLTYIIQRDGVYYLKVRAWDHPGAGGPQHYYTLKTFPFMGDASRIFMPLARR